jgi:lipopolysaccharide/colanic/teichoic acid biosynthesis glycosyltransferase
MYDLRGAGSCTEGRSVQGGPITIKGRATPGKGAPAGVGGSDGAPPDDPAATALVGVSRRNGLPAGSAQPRSRPVATAAKRVVDIALSALLLAIGAPLFLLFALLIKADSPGPVLFRQPRVGRHGEVFGMLKFRTMTRDAESRKLALLELNEAPDGLFKISADPRVTRIGRFLRTTSLDELPQLLHVLTGRMSLVGPRPLVPEEDALIDGGNRQRLEMRPGMTGPWQVAGASRIPIREMVVLDREYVAGWSVLGDLGLLVRTAPHVLRRRGR